MPVLGSPIRIMASRAAILRSMLPQGNGRVVANRSPTAICYHGDPAGTDGADGGVCDPDGAPEAQPKFDK